MEMTVEERNTFIEENMGLIGRVAKHYLPIATARGYEYNDLVSQGVIGIIKGIKKYDIERATKEDGKVVPLNAFINDYIRKSIGRDFATRFRKHDKPENKVSMQTPTTTNIGEVVYLEDMISDENASSEKNETQNMLNSLVDKILDLHILSDVEKICIKMKFIENKTLKEIDTKMRKLTNKPTFNSFFHCNTAKKKIKRYLSNEMNLSGMNDIL